MIGDPSTTTTYTITWRKLGEDATRTSRVAITEGYNHRRPAGQRGVPRMTSVTKQQVLAEAATTSDSADVTAAIVAAVRATPATILRSMARDAQADGLSSPGAIAQEVAWHVAMAAGIEW